MAKNSIAQFLKDGDGDWSSSRLGMLFGLLIGGAVCLIMALNHTLDGVVFGCFMAASGGVYGFGKHQDAKVRIAESGAEQVNIDVENVEVEGVSLEPENRKI